MELAVIKELKQTVQLGIVLVLALGAVIASAQSVDKSTLAAELQDRFTLTEVSADRSDIVTPGTQVQFRLGGLWMYSVAAPSAPASEYKNGKITMGAGAFGRNMLSLMSSTDGILLPQHEFSAGDTCWVIGIDVGRGGVLFRLYSDAIQGLHYYANLKIDFPPKKVVPNVAEMMAVVTEVLTPAAVQPVTQSGNTPSQQAAVAAAAVSYQEIAPPPPPPAPAPTVTIGMSREQLIDAMGAPTQKAIAGTREILFYSDTKMKITLTNGSVTAIE
jgi:hypothetical protein